MGKNVTDVGLEKKAVVPELKKHAASIHCSNTLSLLQRKISNALLYHAYKELRAKEEHEISVKQLCKLISYSGNNHAAIKEALKGLLSTVIEWNVVNDITGCEDWTASSILASVSLQGPICYYAYSPRMKQLLHSPSMFGKINLFIQSRFKSSYGLALYENCIRYRGLPYTKWFEIDIFRKIMGVPADKYPIFRDFKKRVLDKSVDEVNTYSDLIVEAEVYREGRQVTKVRFSLKERAKKTRLGAKVEASNNPNEATPELHVKLVNQFGLSSEQAQQVISDYSQDFISEKIDIIEASKNYQKGKVHNIAGYLLSALKNDYKQEKSSLKALAVKQTQALEDQQHYKMIKRYVDEMREAYVAYREQLIDSELKMLTAKEKAVFLERFEQHAAQSINTILRLQRNKYTRETVMNSPQIQALLRQFALRELPILREMTQSFEKFSENFSEQHRHAWQQLQLIEGHTENLEVAEVD